MKMTGDNFKKLRAPELRLCVWDPPTEPDLFPSGHIIALYGGSTLAHLLLLLMQLHPKVFERGHDKITYEQNGMRLRDTESQLLKNA